MAGPENSWVGWDVLQAAAAWATAHPHVAFTMADLPPIAGKAVRALSMADLSVHLKQLERLGFLYAWVGAPEGHWHCTPLGRRTVELHRQEESAWRTEVKRPRLDRRLQRQGSGQAPRSGPDSS